MTRAARPGHLSSHYRSDSKCWPVPDDHHAKWPIWFVPSRSPADRTITLSPDRQTPRKQTYGDPRRRDNRPNMGPMNYWGAESVRFGMILNGRSPRRQHWENVCWLELSPVTMPDDSRNWGTHVEIYPGSPLGRHKLICGALASYTCMYEVHAVYECHQ